MRNNWENVSLFEIAENTPKSFVDGDWIESPYITDEGIRLIQTGNIGIGVFKNKNKKYISEDSFKLLKCTEVYPGDVLICRLAEPIGRACIVPENNERYITSVDVSILRVSNKYSKEFVHLYLNTEEFLKKAELLSGGSTRQRISRINLGNIRFDIPPLPQQRKIAEILSTCDAVIEKTEAAIAKYQAIKQGMMHDLFTRGIDVNTGKLRPSYQEAPHLYKESELGWIPKEWKVRKLEEISKINGRVGWKGYTVKDLRDRGPLAIGAAQIDKFNKLNLTNPVMLSYEKFYESPEIMIKKGDLLVVQRGSIGKYVIIDKEIGDATINPSIVLINNISINSHFLYYSFGSKIIENQITNSTSQTGVPMISQFQINNFKFLLPKSNLEIEKITEIIKNIDNKILMEQSALSKYQQIKVGLMQDLLSGKVEVKV